MLWTAPIEIATLEVERNTRPVVPACFTTEQSTVKASLFVIKNVQECYGICQNVPWAWFYQWSLNPALYSLSFTLYFVLLII